MQQSTRFRTLLGALTGATLAIALLAPVSLAGNGNGNGNGQGNGQAKQEQQAAKQAAKQQEQAAKQAAKEQQRATKEAAKQAAKEQQRAAKEAAKQERRAAQQVKQATTHASTSTEGTATADSGHAKVVVDQAAKQSCKKGGWRLLQREDGSRFTNQGRCVSYVVRGGVVAPLLPSVTVTYAPTLEPDYCLVTVNLVDLAPNTTYSGVVTIRSLGTIFAPYPSDIATDAYGEASVAVFSYLQGYFDNSANADYAGLSSGYSPISC